jgi:hypothetical protein
MIYFYLQICYNNNLNAIGQAYAEDMKNIDQEAADRLKKNAYEIAKTRKEWQSAIDEASAPGAAGPEKKPKSNPKIGEVADQSAAAVGTFSSFGLSQLGAGGVIQKIALATERTANACEDIADNGGGGMEFE